MRRFTLLFLTVAGLSLALFLAFNLAVDPFDVLGGPRVHGFNGDKTRRDMDGRRVVAGFRLLEPHRTVLLGNSRVWDGFRDAPAPWDAHPLNAGLPASSAYELGRAMTLAGRSGTDCVVLGLELSDYNDINKVKGSFWISPLLDGSRPSATARMAVSPLTFSRALETVQDNAAGRKAPEPWLDVYPRGEQRRRFQQMAQEYWSSYASYSYDHERVRYVAEIVDRLTQRGVQVVPVFIPTHAWATEAVFRGGADKALFAFRRDLVTALDRYADRKPKAACVPGGSVVIWDFSGFQPFSEAPLPARDQTRPHPTFYEAAHFTPLLGTQMLARIGGAAPDATVTGAGPFGVRLTPANLAAEDAALLARRAAWLATDEGREADAFFDTVAGRAKPNAGTQRVYLTRDDWKALDRDLPRLKPSKALPQTATITRTQPTRG